jgi:hypothetical protein
MGTGQANRSWNCRLGRLEHDTAIVAHHTGSAWGHDAIALQNSNDRFRGQTEQTSRMSPSARFRRKLEMKPAALSFRREVFAIPDRAH